MIVWLRQAVCPTDTRAVLAPLLGAAEIGIACGLALVAFFVTVPFAGIGLDPHHDGIMLKPALDVADGQVVFRDTFSQYGPLTTFLQAGVLTISPTLLALKVMAVAADSLAIGLFYLVWRSILPRSLAVASAAMFVLLNPVFVSVWTVLPWSSDIAMFFQAVAWLALVQTIVATRQLPWAILLGVASAAVFWCRQPVGVSLGGTLGFVAAGLFASGWPEAAGRRAGVVAVVAALGGMVSVSGVMLGYLWANDALPAWWFQNIVWPKRCAGAGGPVVLLVPFAYHFLNPAKGCLVAISLGFGLAPAVARTRWPKLPGWLDWLTIGLAVVGVVVSGPSTIEALHLLDGGWRVVLSVAVILLAMWRLVTLVPRFASLRPPDYRLSAALAAVGLASLTQLYPVPCLRHLFWAIGPAVGVAVYAVWRATNCTPGVLAVSLALVAIPSAWSAADAGRSKTREASVTLIQPEVLRGIRVDSGEALKAARMADILRRMEQTDPFRPFVLIGNDALPLACVRNRVNLTPMYVTWAGLMSAEQEAKWSARFDEERPFVILQAVTPESRNEFLSQHGYTVVGEIPAKKLAFLAPAESAVAAGP